MQTNPNIGISEGQRNEIAKGLAHFMADTYTLYLKTHGFHWNVTGAMFNTLHLMFETQYNELWMAIDVIAERIRALDAFAPGSYAELSKLPLVRFRSGYSCPGVSHQRGGAKRCRQHCRLGERCKRRSG